MAKTTKIQTQVATSVYDELLARAGGTKQLSAYIRQILNDHVGQSAAGTQVKNGGTRWQRPKVGDVVTIKPEAWRLYEADEAQDVLLLSGKPITVVRLTRYGVIVTDGKISQLVKFADLVRGNDDTADVGVRHDYLQRKNTLE